MRKLLGAIALTFAIPSGAALADKAPPVCKARFEATYNTGVRAEADAPDEAAARKIFEDWAAEQNKKEADKAAPSDKGQKKAARLALDRVRRLADNCKGLQSFLVFN